MLIPRLLARQKVHFECRNFLQCERVSFRIRIHQMRAKIINMDCVVVTVTM